MIRRSAEAEWRWARAISPGITIWRLATSVLLADTPGSSGLVRRSTRRSACSVPTSSAARIAWGRRSRRRHVLRSELRVVVPQLLVRRLDVGEFQHWASSSDLALSRTERGLRRRNRCRSELIQLHSGFDLLVPTPGAHVHHEPIRALVLSVDLVAARALGAMCRLERGTRLREVIDVEADVVDALDGGRPFAEVGCVVAAVLEDGKIDVTIAQPHALGSGVGGLAT